MTETVIELIICYFTGKYWVPPHSHRLNLYLNSWENWWRQMTRFYVDIKSKIPPTNALIQRTHTNYYLMLYQYTEYFFEKKRANYVAVF